jgi:hypothetical protein
MINVQFNQNQNARKRAKMHKTLQKSGFEFIFLVFSEQMLRVNFVGAEFGTHVFANFSFFETQILLSSSLVCKYFSALPLSQIMAKAPLN